MKDIKEGSRVKVQWGILKGWIGTVFAKSYSAGMKGIGSGWKCGIKWDNGQISWSIDEGQLELLTN